LLKPNSVTSCVLATHDCSLVFPNKKKQNFERIDAMLATNNHVKRKKDERNPLNLALIA
jgi:hypothetical protein